MIDQAEEQVCERGVFGLFNRAVSAGWMILALLILRPVLKKLRHGCGVCCGACGGAARAADPVRERVEFGAECGDAFTKYGSI